MRVLITCWPFEGHVLPNLAIAHALRDRGAEVAVYTAPSALPTVRAEGFEGFGFEAVGPAWERVAAREAQVGGRRQSMRVARQAFVDWIIATIPGQAADVGAIVDRFKPDVIVTDMMMYGPSLITWEQTRIPVVVSSPLMSCILPGRDVPFPSLGLAPFERPAVRTLARAVRRIADAAAAGVRKQVDGIRADHGLPPLGDTINGFMRRLPLYLQMSVPELDHDRRDLPGNVRYIGACVFHPAESPETRAWLDGLPTDRPWVHVTEGTSHHQDPFLLRAASAGLAGAPVEAILTTGSGRTTGEARSDLGLTDAPNVHVRDWLGHAELLPRCAAIATTGGAGTVMAALRAGVPLVVAPTTWDKPANASRVVAAGAGVRLKPSQCTPGAFRAAVDDILANDGYRLAARRVADALAAAPGPSGAAELIVGMVPGASTHTVVGGRT